MAEGFVDCPSKKKRRDRYATPCAPSGGSSLAVRAVSLACLLVLALGAPGDDEPACGGPASTACARFPREHGKARAVCFVTLDMPYTRVSRGTAAAMAALIDAVVEMEGTEVLLWTMDTDAVCREMEGNIPKNPRLSHVCLRSDEPAFASDPQTQYVPPPMRGANRLVRWFRAHDHVHCDVLVAHEWSGPFNFLMESRRERAVFVTIVHGGTQWDQYWMNQGDIAELAANMQNAEEKRQWMQSDVIVYPSRYMHEYTRREWGNMADKRSWVVPNILPKARAGTAAGGAYNMTATRNVAFIGVMDERKGFDKFVKLACAAAAAASAHSVHAHAFAAVVSVERAAAEGACGNVVWTFHGTVKRDAMWALMRQLQALLLYTSRHDNLPMVPLEASFHDVPVIASQRGTGGLKEYLLNEHVVLYRLASEMQEAVATAVKTGHVAHLVPHLRPELHAAATTWQMLFREVIFKTAANQAAAHRMRAKGTASLHDTTARDTKRLKLLDVRNWTSATDVCGIGATYDQYVLLHDSRMWEPRADLVSVVVEKLGALTAPVDVIVPCYNVDARGAPGRAPVVGYAYEPLWMTQWGWLSCLPAAPILVLVDAWCAWSSKQMRTTAVDFVIPRFGLHAFNNNLQVKRTGTCWFSMKANIIKSRDCRYGHELKLRHDADHSFVFYRTPDSSRRVRSHCKGTRQSWLDAAMRPVDCVAKALLVDPAFTDFVSDTCGAHCIMHPDVRHRPDEGWAFNPKRACWTTVSAMSKHPSCGKHVKTLPRNEFPYLPP